MPFAQVKKSSVGSPIHVNEIRMGWHKAAPNSNTKTRTLYFSIARSVIDEVGWDITETGEDDKKLPTCSVGLMEGTHSEAGFLMMVEDKSHNGYRLGGSRALSSAAAFAFGITLSRLKHYVLNNLEDEEQPRSVEFTVDAEEHTILIECPDWLRYNPLSVEPLPQPEPEPPEPEPKMKVTIDNVPTKAKKLNRSQRRLVASTVAHSLKR
jgi:hypothetical protein